MMQADNHIISGQLFRPIERVGIYVPGGTAVYPSSVLMNAIPAVLAGVEEVYMTTPVKDGGEELAPILLSQQILLVLQLFTVLAACRLLLH